MGTFESYISAKILDALSSGNFKEFLAYILIFIFIWLEVRGMKKELKNLNTTVTKSFSEGEKRFDTIENQCQNFEHRITQLENASAKANDRIFLIETKITNGGLKHEINS